MQVSASTPKRSRTTRSPRLIASRIKGFSRRCLFSMHSDDAMTTGTGLLHGSEIPELDRAGKMILKVSGTMTTYANSISQPLEEVAERKPQAILLPDEPHPFSEADAEVFRPLGARVVFCGGRDLSWYGAQSVEGLPRLKKLIDSLR